MPFRPHSHPATIALAGLIIAGPVAAQVMEFTDWTEWQAAAGSFTTIDFTGYPIGTPITNQYTDLGVLFTDGSDYIDHVSVGYPNDGWGLDGNMLIALSFLSPQQLIAADFPGGLQIELYCNGQLIYASSEFGGTGYGHFAGLASTEPFDEAVITDWVGNEVFLDDLHFAVPAPGALGLLALAGCLPGRRRRECSSGRPIG